jgi:thiosulfate/3-mercaptopyruvate sulfurtransferase
MQYFIKEKIMSSLILPGELVSVDWLSEQISHHDLVLLDASFFMPGVERDGRQEWLVERIPGAVFFDFDREICDPASELPHMMPDADGFQESVRNLGVKQNSIIVVYDSLGIFSAPRVWWMLKAMGAEQVAVLDGGLPAWKAQSLPLESGEPVKRLDTGNFTACYQDGMFCNAEEVLVATQNKQRIIIDARSRERFLAQVPEPREGVRSGHMPNARNLPFAEILSEQKMCDAYQLALLFAVVAGKDNGLIFSCGSGVTACILALGATLAGYGNISVYDGSWAEWGGSSELPVVS